MKIIIHFILAFVVITTNSFSQTQILPDFRGLKWGSNLKQAKTVFNGKDFYNFSVREEYDEMKAYYFFDNIFDNTAKVFLVFVKGKFLRAEINFEELSDLQLASLILKTKEVLKEKYGAQSPESEPRDLIWKFDNATIEVLYNISINSFSIYYATSQYDSWLENIQQKNNSKDKSKF